MGEQRKQILVVDDEQSIRDSLQLLLKNNFDVALAESGESALNVFDQSNPDLVLLDMMMPGLDGIETLKKLREKNSNVPVVMLTAVNTVRTAVDAMKCGAADYLNKPFDFEELSSLIVKTLDHSPVLQSSVTVGPSRELPEGDFGPLVGSSVPMTELFERVSNVAKNDTTVLITGESGTGKELIARQIHQRSDRASKPFVAVNCAAIPETLIESELFGHEKGAFTHAVEKRLGHFELANGGTLFLDEIGELSMNVQVKMLRFLQEQEFYRVGQSKPTRVDVRVVAATNKDLEEQIKRNQFRQDLYYRINVINLAIPPLRSRYEDIPGLIQHFIKKYSEQYGGKKLEFEADALSTMVQYDWPGNVRELENVIESMMALSQKESIAEEDLPPKVKRRVSSDVMKFNIFDGNFSFEEAEKKFETEMIEKALKRTNYVQTRAAELLGISRRILKYKMDKLGIKSEPQST